MAASNPNPISDFSQTQRIVLLIDLNPLLHLPDPTPYVTSLLSAAQTLISFPALLRSLFSFKFIFSSLSPLLSSSKLPNFSLSLSFNHPIPTLSSLSYALDSLPSLYNPSSYSPPRASCIASLMRQVLHDYAWDSISDDPLGTLNCKSIVRTNLVVLFSPICRSVKWASELLGVEMDGEMIESVHAFCEKFVGFFENVNNAFVSKDIHFSWIDVKCEGGSDEEFDECKFGSGFYESGCKSLGWGFCSTDSIVLGAALIPFGLLYPMIGISSNFFNINQSREKLCGHLILEILDVNQKPLECKCCELEFVNLKLPLRDKSDVLLDPEFINVPSVGHNQKNLFWEKYSRCKMKVQIKGLKKYEECLKLEGQLPESVLVRELYEECGTLQKEGSGISYADKVFDILEMELGDFTSRKSVPIWQILLSFLYREGYCALVTFSNDNNNSCMGILKPFTISSALLTIIDIGCCPHKVVHDSRGILPKDNENSKPNTETKGLNGLIDSQAGPQLANKCNALNDSKRRKAKVNSLLHQDLTWVAFCKAAIEHSKMKLEEVYFDGTCKNSKKLKFLKCWMKQTKRSSCCGLSIPDESKPNQDIPKEIENILSQEIEQPPSLSASAGEESLTGASRIQDEVALDFCSETSESFFSNLSNKIQQGLESQEVDLVALANRLVRSTIYWLHQKREMEITSESETHVVKSENSCGSTFSAELVDLLLKEPKHLAERHKNNEPSLQASDLRPTGLTSANIVREYELQILFRMEILLSEVAVNISEATKQKFVKHICLLLESIQCHMEGGFFGDWSLDNYVERIIKRRYSGRLGDVVLRIYTKMDLLLFGDEAESPNALLNSEDSNQSWKGKHDKDEMNRSARVFLSSEDEFLQPSEGVHHSPQGIEQEDHARRLTEARERRERARRFASFTSWRPDFQRVWAPKQLKVTKSKSLSKRKGRQSYDMVCETPMTGNKRSCPQGSKTDAENHHSSETHSCGSVSKALFQDDR